MIVAPRKAQSGGNRRAFKKSTEVTYRVKVPTSQSLTSRLEANLAGKLGNEGLEPRGASEQAV